MALEPMPSWLCPRSYLCPLLRLFHQVAMPLSKVDSIIPDQMATSVHEISKFPVDPDAV
jgi:hypothetical protein